MEINQLQQVQRKVKALTPVHLSLPAKGGVDKGRLGRFLVLVERVDDVVEHALELGPLGLVPLEPVVVVEVDEDDGGDDEADPDEEEPAHGGADDDGQRDARALRPLRPRAVVQLLFFGMGHQFVIDFLSTQISDPC